MPLVEPIFRDVWPILEQLKLSQANMTNVQSLEPTCNIQIIELLGLIGTPFSKTSMLLGLCIKGEKGYCPKVLLGHQMYMARL